MVDDDDLDARAVEAEWNDGGDAGRGYTRTEIADVLSRTGLLVLTEQLEELLERRERRALPDA